MSICGDLTNIFCTWSFNELNGQCILKQCTSVYGTFERWEDCQPCCYLMQYSRNSVANCIYEQNINLGVSLAITIGYPVIGIISILALMRKMGFYSIIVGIFWPPLLIIGLCCGGSIKARQATNN